MKNKMIIAALASVVAVMQLTSPVMANDVTEQSQEQKLKQECVTETTSSYGQVNVKNTCKQEGEQKQHQKIVYKDGKLYHKPVDTALDIKTVSVAVGVLAIAIAAYVANRRLA